MTRDNGGFGVIGDPDGGTLPLSPGRQGDRPGAEALAVPAYLRDTYTWAYLRPSSVRILDRPAIVHGILWGNYNRLVRAVLAELAPGQRVFQPACVYGDFSPRVAGRLGPEGRLDVADIAPVQLANAERKLARLPNARVRRHDASHRLGERYDAVCCFFLLHEMPAGYRRRTVDALLDAVEPGGRAIFVDYHRPHPAHPLRWLMSLVFDTLEPFAKDLWRDEIASHASRPEDFAWRKRICFGGLYQVVVAERAAADGAPAR